MLDTPSEASRSSLRTVSEGARVLLHYSLSTEHELIDTTESLAPLDLTIGQGQLHPAIEKLLLGRLEGEAFECSLDSSLAFGAVNSDLIFSMARAKLPEKIRALKLGATFEGLGPDRRRHLFRVVEDTPQRMTFDGNHPFAGQDLFLKAEIVRVF